MDASGALLRSPDRFWTFRPEQLEISDRITRWSPETLARLPVDRSAVADAFRAEGNPYAAALVEAMPASPDGVLDADAVDRLLLAAHRELQRLALELEQGARTAMRLRPLLARIRSEVRERPLVVVDVGCGLGYVVRWLAAWGDLGEDVALHGADFNAALIGEARRLAQAEGIAATFHHRDAFALGLRAHVYLSTGVLHHVPKAALPHLFRAAREAGAMAWLHADFQPSPFAPFGAWLFHRVRMRLSLARHDGILSAIRAHPSDALLATAAEGAPDWRHAVHGRTVAPLVPLPRAMHTLVGVCPELASVLDVLP